MDVSPMRAGRTSPGFGYGEAGPPYENRAGDDRSTGAGGWRPGLVLEDERHLHGDAVFGNLAVGDAGLLLEHMQSGNSAQRLAGAGQSLTHGVIEAPR